MTRQTIFLFCFSLLGFTAVGAGTPSVTPAPNGIEFPADYPNWRVISMSHRVDNKTMRVILGNEVAIKAAREGNTKPWPDGAVLGKVVWKETEKADCVEGSNSTE